MLITKEQVAKVLEVVDCGLVPGVGQPIPGRMCVEAAVCYALGEPHGDQPSCVGAAVRHFKIGLNDTKWSSEQARAKGLREIAIAQLGSVELDQREFVRRLSIAVVRDLLSRVCKMRGLVAEGEQCARVTTREEAYKAAISVRRKFHAAAYAAAANAANADAAAANAAYADAAAANAAYADAAAANAAYAANADAAYADANAAAAAANAAYADAANAAYADAANAANADAAYARDAVLTFAARLGTQVLLDMGSPGCAWLSLL